MNTSNSPIALVTGGSRGLGRSIALALAAQGSDILLTYKERAEDAQEVVRRVQALGRRAVALQLDVADSASFPAFAARVREALAREWGRERFDHLVNNAGTGLHATIEQTTEAQFDQLYAVHLKATFFLTQKLLPLVRDGGRILNVSSGLARFTFAGAAAYAAMKGGIEVLTRYMALELGPRGIAVNTVAPGAIETDFNAGTVRDDRAVNARIASVTALGRAGLPDDVGGAVAALLAPGSGWITGQRVEVSGGMML